MNESLQIQAKAHAESSFKPALSGLLQRQCACGQYTGAGDECESCRKKREATLQRAAIGAPLVSAVPPIVYEVLRSPGQPLDANASTFVESRFGHDSHRYACLLKEL
jgi:hypothetical protein